MKNENNIKKGKKLYSDFTDKILPHIDLATPSTNTLELFGFLSINNREQLVAEMCRELITNFDEGYFIEDNKLKQKIEFNINITNGLIK